MIRQFTFTLLLWLISYQLFSQTTILGYYENQTGATERMGEIIDIKPNHKVFIYSKEYNATILINKGSWSVFDDTLFLDFGKERRLLKIINENLLSTFPIPLNDTIINGKRLLLNFFSDTFWTKTLNYYENGKIESERSVRSISDISPDITPEGIWKFYYENGLIKATGLFKKGKKKGKWVYFSETGERIK